MNWEGVCGRMWRRVSYRGLKRIGGGGAHIERVKGSVEVLEGLLEFK